MKVRNAHALSTLRNLGVVRGFGMREAACLVPQCISTERGVAAPANSTQRSSQPATPLDGPEQSLRSSASGRSAHQRSKSGLHNDGSMMSILAGAISNHRTCSTHVSALRACTVD